MTKLINLAIGACLLAAWPVQAMTSTTLEALPVSEAEITVDGNLDEWPGKATHFKLLDQETPTATPSGKACFQLAYDSATQTLFVGQYMKLDRDLSNAAYSSSVTISIQGAEPVILKYEVGNPDSKGQAYETVVADENNGKSIYYEWKIDMSAHANVDIAAIGFDTWVSETHNDDMRIYSWMPGAETSLAKLPLSR